MNGLTDAHEHDHEYEYDDGLPPRRSVQVRSADPNVWKPVIVIVGVLVVVLVR